MSRDRQAMGGLLEGRRILVTGAASGIGLETARQMIDGGAKVAAVDRNAELLSESARSIGAVPIAADLTDLLQVEKAVADAATALGGLDGLVNGAGAPGHGPLMAMQPQDWDRLLAINLTAPFLVCRQAYPYLLKAGGGTIVNVASATGLKPSGANGAYASAKAGLIMMTKVLASEVGPGIRVNAVCPGPVDTPQLHKAQPDPELRRQKAAKDYALGRVASAGEIARVIVFLTGPDSSFITGSAIAADGGRVFH